ncbi:MAG TPA: fibronectin type III domain-containing protein, partial [Ferruginibacter sp.]|nr:fibronectin type III domain-containing protein [Ferruginibacter sp.]
MNNFTGTQGTSLHTATTTVLNAKGNTAFSNWAFRLLFLCLTIALTTGVSKAQLVANYSFNATSGTYTPISGGTVSHASGWDDTQVNSVPIGFPFWFNGKVYDIISINPNGSIIFQNGTGTTSPSYTPISGTGTYFGAVGAWGRDLQAQNTAPLGEIQYQSSGGVFTVQWSNARRYNSTTTNAERINFQIKLYEATGVVEIVYGDWSNAISATSTSVGQVGLRGLNNSDYNNLSVLATDNWLTPLAGASNAATVYYNEATPAVKPAEGLTYTYTPIAPVGVPTGLNFTSVQALQLTVNWTDNSTEEAGYIVQYSADGGTTWTTATVTAADATSTTVTGLSASTNYDWRVAAIREVPGTFVSASQATTAPGNNVSLQSGNWSDPNTWSLGTVPTSSDNVTVGSGHEVVMDIDGDAYSLTVTGGGVLRSEELPSPTARTVTVLNDVVINASSTLRSAALSPFSVVNNTLSIGGNMTINGDGTFDGSASGNGKLNLLFTGASDNSFTSSATATINLNTLTINKGAGPINILEFSPGADFTSPVAGFATLTNGILKLGGTATWSNPVIALSTPTISANGGIWLDNPNATVTAKNASSSISGYFRLSQGTYNIGTLATSIIGGATTTNMIIEGGTLNVSGRLYITSTCSFTMSGGTINVQTAGNNTASANGSFGFSSTTTTFNMSGGVINILHPSTGATPYDTYINVTNPNITGGLINIGVPGITPPASVFNGVRQRVPSIHIGDGFTATSGAALTVLGNLSVGTGATYNFNNTASTNFVLTINGNSSAPGNIINNGLITHNLANTQAIRMQMFGQHGVQTISGTGSIGTSTGPIFGMGISNPAGINVTSANAVYTNRINLFEGDVTGANNITMGNSTATVIQISQDNSLVMGGSLDASPTFNTSGHTILYLDEPNPRTTGFEIPTSRIVSNISITNDNSDLTLAGGNVTTTSLDLN